MLKNMKIYGFLLTCLFTVCAGAQDKLEVKGKMPDRHVLYVSNGTETLQTVSNQFGFSVTKLSSYNAININASAVLPKGTAIRIPLTRDNLLQHASDNSAPVVHVIGKGDNLYRLSKIYHNISMASLREWNHLKNDLVKAGQQVIIGYMVNAKPTETKDLKPTVIKDIPAVQSPGYNTQADPGKIYTEKKQPPAPTPVKKEEPVIGPASELLPGTKKQSEEKPATDNKPLKEEPKETPVVTDVYVPAEGDEGYYASGYAEHEKARLQQFRSGDAATFKTISGWTDRKYYVLMNDIAPKTIVRITGPGNKSVCAMVLGPLQETKGASGLLLRISNSAASALGIADQKFTVTVTYFE